MEKIIVLSIPFLGTAFGAAMVFFLKGKMNRKLEKILLGFASGVMMAASVWSLLMPAIELEQQQGGIAWFPAAAGFLMGVGFLLALDRLVPRLRPEGKKQGEADADIQKTVMLVLAVFPQILGWFAALVGIYDPTNALFAFMFFCVIILLMSITAIVSKLNEKSKQLIQSVALLEKRVRELEDEG